jgi:hypothetical protein
MKKYLFILVVIALAIYSTEVFAVGLSANRILNPGFNQDTWWGADSVLAYRWNRSPANNSYCRTTSDGYNSDGAIWVQTSPSQPTTGWSSQFRVAAADGASYTCSAWAKWNGCTVPNGIQMLVTVYDNNLPQTILGTFVPCATTGSSSDNWVKLTGTFAIPAGGACADVFLGTIDANTETMVQFDDVKMQTANDPNLLINAGFEGFDSGNYPGYWRRNTSAPRGNWTNTTFYSGTACTFIRQSTATGYKMFYDAQGATRAYLAIDPNKTYLYGGWMTWDFVTSGGVGIGIQWFDAQDNTIGGDSAPAGGGDLSIPPVMSIAVFDSNPTWTYLVATATPPTNANYARFILWNVSTSLQPPGAEVISWYDDVVFKDLPPVIEVTPSSANISLGDTKIFGANGGTAPYTWTSSDTSIGSIDAVSGLFTALSLGTTTITATDDDGFTGTASAVIIATKAPIFSEPQSVIIHRMMPFGELYK